MTALLLASLALAAPVPKAGAPELKWRFQKGDTFYVKYERDETSTVTFGGAAAAARDFRIIGVTVWKWSVVSVGEKEIELEQEYISVKAGVEAGVKAPALHEEKSVIGKKVTITLDAAHKIKKLDVSAMGVGPGVAGIFVSEGELHQQLDVLFHSIPGKVMSQGEKWTGESETKLNGDLVAKKTSRGTVTAIDNGVAKLTLESEHSLSGSTGPKAGSLSYDLKGEKGSSKIWFDTTVGRPRKLEDAYTIAGEVEHGALGQKGSLTKGVKATVTISDDKPKDE